MGEAVASFLLRPLSFLGFVCFGERQRTSPTFVRPTDWAGLSPSVDQEARREAGAQLTRKYLHSFGPATASMFASWLGSSPQQAQALWRRIEGEMTPVECGGRKGWVLTADLESFLGEPPAQHPLRLLGPHDPYLDLRDKELICPDRSLQLQVWRTTVNPGVVLLDGQVVGTWEQATQADRLTVRCRLVRPLDAVHVEAIRAEAEGLAAFRSKRLVAVQVET